MNAKTKKADPARLTALRVLREVTEENAFSNQSLDRQLRLAELLPQSRAFAAALVYGSLNRLAAIDAQLEKYLQRPLKELDPEVLACLRLGAWQIFYAYSVPKPSAVDESVRLCRYLGKGSAGSLVNAVLRRLPEGEPVFPRRHKGLALGLGNELYGLFKNWFGEEKAEAIGNAFLKEELSVSLRPNRRRGGQEICRRKLLAEQCQLSHGFFLPHALRLISSPKRLDQLSAYREGLFMIQDEAAQLCGELAPLQGSRLILDLCAAPGGKSCDLAERMPENARLLALDRSEERLEKARRNAERLGLDIQFATADASSPELKKRVEELLGEKAEADFVLCDVPCSGLGLLGRKPEIRQRIGYDDLKRFPPLQAAILRRGAELVKKGGYLMYSSCTLNPAENEELLRAFLRSPEGADFQSVLRAEDLPEGLARPLHEDEHGAALLKEGFLQLRPDLLPCDGFFIALLRKEPCETELS